MWYAIINILKMNYFGKLNPWFINKKKGKSYMNVENQTNYQNPTDNYKAYDDQSALIKKIKTESIISLVLFFTIIFTIVSLVLTIVASVRILSTTWNNKEVEDSKIIWGILSILILGPIGTLIFAIIAKDKV